jgi:type I restriction enzyme S subunit
MYYWFLSHQQELLAASVGGRQPNLSQDIIRSLRILTPDPQYQTAIAEFLDRETAKIDDLIAKKQSLADLIIQRNLSFTIRAITSGLHPGRAVKPSRVEWIGSVPSHWDVAPLYARYNVQLGKMLDEKQITGDHRAPYLRNVDVQWGRINVEDLPTMDFDPQDRLKFLLLPGDLLICEGGEVGRSAVWNGDLSVCYFQKAIHRLRPTRGDHPMHLFYVMRAAVSSGLFESSTNLSTIGHLTAEKLRRYRFPFPPLAEQAEIVHQLEEDSQKTSDATAKITAAISLLREYRSALISAAVTGQLDLRQHEAQLEALA